MEEENNYNEDIYDFSIIGVLQEAFRLSDGSKLKIMGALGIYIVIAIFSSAILGIIFPKDASSVNETLTSLISVPITLPLLIGITMLGINRARDESLEIPSIFNYYNMLFSLLIAYFLMNILIVVGIMLLIIPGIYLAISYTFAYPLIVDKGLGVWEAMELSRKTVTKQWFKFFGLAIATGVIVLISAIPLGIGLIWSIPTTYISYGLLYHHLFDDE